MTSKVFPALCAVLLAIPVAAAANRDGETVSFGTDCGTSGCRSGGTTLEIDGADGHHYKIPVAHSPYVLPDGTIVIYPGEKLVFAIADGDAPGTPHLLASGAPAEPGTATVSFDYQAYGTMMMLNIVNGSSRTLKADLYPGMPDGDSFRLRYTSSCALMPGLFDSESWPAPLGPIFISNIHALSSGGSDTKSGTMTMRCE